MLAIFPTTDTPNTIQIAGLYGPRDQAACMAAYTCMACPTLHDPMDSSSPYSSVHGIPQVRIPECIAIPFSRGSSWPRDQTWVSSIAGRFFTVWTTRVALHALGPIQNYQTSMLPDISPGQVFLDVVCVASRTQRLCFLFCGRKCKMWWFVSYLGVGIPTPSWLLDSWEHHWRRRFLNLQRIWVLSWSTCVLARPPEGWPPLAQPIQSAWYNQCNGL